MSSVFCCEISSEPSVILGRYNHYMDPVLMWLARGISVLLGLSHGYFLATIPAHWSEDRWNEDEPHPRGSELDGSDSSGLFSGCLSVFVYISAYIQHGYRLYGFARVIAPSLTFILAAIGWPLDYEAFKEVGQLVYCYFFLVLFEPFFWFALGSMTAGYLAGRVLKYKNEQSGRRQI